ncbi:Alb1p PWA37_005268 [Arxiozyma heterogenica]|uniref:Ribosome biogenesis protein ALB1 n=1 Tax=Arxiozyma heterogenica TaxID=278026 RepID=A0AAN7W6D6_9SACH|nr:hypothetical protein RI543_000201 [Kazachstania heterogenica]
MPSKNSINRPKLTTNLKSKAQKAGLKRSQREQRGDFKPARSSEQSKSGEIKSVALDLYFQNEKGKNDSDVVVKNGPITRKTLSKKRAKKIERNLKYAQQRKKELQILTDLQAKKDNEMDLDLDSIRNNNSNRNKNKILKKSKLSLIKDAMWNVLEDTQSIGNLSLSTSGQGTTLGGAWFP